MPTLILHPLLILFSSIFFFLRVSDSHPGVHYRLIRLEEWGTGAMDASRLPRLTDSRDHQPSATGDRPDCSVVVDSHIGDRRHSNRMAGGRRREQRRRRGSSESMESSLDECCCSRNCNTQICCSYLFAVLSSGLVVGGVYLSIVEWNRLWLAISVFGLFLVFFGACLYCCGTRSLSRKYSGRHGSEYFDERFDDEPVVEDSRQRRAGRNKRKRRNRPEDVEESATDRRVNASRSLSQLSLNMIPQYFAPSDTGSTAPGQLLAPSSRTNTLMTTTSAGAQSQAASVPFSQIFSLNGQSFLILPIANESLEASRQRNSSSSEQSIPLNSLVVKVPAGEDHSVPTDDFIRRPTVTEFLAKLDPKSYCLFKSGQTQSSFLQQDHTAVQVEDDSSLASAASSHIFPSSRPSVSCEDSGIYSNSHSSQNQTPANDSSSGHVAVNAGKSAAASCASSSVTSADVSSPSSSSSSGMAVASHARHHNQKDAKSHTPKPAARITKSVPVTGTSVVTIDHKKSSVPDPGWSGRGTAGGSEENATTSNSFFISFPAEGSGKRSEKGNPRTPVVMQASTSTASTSFQDNQKVRHQKKDSSLPPAQEQDIDSIVAVAGPSFASPPLLVRRDTFSKKKTGKPLIPAQGSESSSEISSPNEEPLSLAGNLIDLMDRRRDSRAEAEAERNHAAFASSRYEELVYDSSDLDDTEFMSPPPSYSEVIDSAMHFSPASDGPPAVGTGTL